MQNKQSIVWLSSSYPRFKQDSASVFLRYLAEAMDKRRYELHILSPDDQEVDASLRSTHIFVHYFRYFMPRSLQKLAFGSGILPNLKANPLLFIQVPFFLISQFFACYKLVKQQQAALIHAHWVFPQGTIACLVARLTQTPVIITAHGGDAFALQGSILARIKYWTLKNCNAWTSNTSATANAFKGDIAAPYIIPMGIDWQKFSAGNGAKLRSYLPQETLVLLFVGRLVAKKGVGDLLTAYALLSNAQRKHTRLWIIGDGAERNTLEKQAQSLQLADMVSFLGKLPNTQLPDYYAAADIFIAPSITDAAGDTEGQGITLVEAMASATAIISTDTGGISEVIQQDKTGLLVAPQDPAKLHAAIVSLIDDPQLRATLASNAQQAARNYSWAQAAQRFQAVYTQLTEH